MLNGFLHRPFRQEHALKDLQVSLSFHGLASCNEYKLLLRNRKHPDKHRTLTSAALQLLTQVVH
ncbi:hypothetical protein D3C76_1811070 [compost metagenome]